MRIQHNFFGMILSLLIFSCSALHCSTGQSAEKKSAPKKITATKQAEKKPNIILLYYDDMGYGDFGINHPANKKSLTPNLDRLAKESMRFTAAHSADGVCSPSRYALLTGRYCWRSRLKIKVLHGYSAPLMEKKRFNIAKFFKKQGYATAMVGKWHLGMQFHDPAGKPVDLGNHRTVLQKNLIDFSKPLSDTPIDHGFDYFFGSSASLDMTPYFWIENRRCLVDGALINKDNSVDFSKAKTATNKTLREGPGKNQGIRRPGAYAPNFSCYNYLQIQVAKIKQYMKEQTAKNKPFFIYVPMPAPHMPWTVQPQFKGKAGFQYGDYVMQTDHYTGEILKAIENPDGDNTTNDSIKSKTILFVTSDNGPETHAFRTSLKNKHDANGPFSGVKRDNWEGGTRVPFLVRWPGVVKPGTVTDHACWQGDILATLTDFFGYQRQKDEAPDTESFLPILQGKPMPAKRRPGFVQHSSRAQFAIVDAQGKWKLLDGTGGGGNGKTWGADNKYTRSGGKIGQQPRQLFDLKSDPGETKNLLIKPTKAALAKEKELLELLNELRKDQDPAKPFAHH